MSDCEPVTRRTYTIEQAAIMLGISRSQAYRLAKSDSFPVPLIRIGAEGLRVPSQALDELVAGRSPAHAG